MHLAYFDDSETKAKARRWQVMSAVIIEDAHSKLTESFLRTFSHMLMGPDKLPTFTEFHACELYGGHGVFATIDKETRMNTIASMLALLEQMDVSVVYGAVDLEDLQSTVYGSADPQDVCFRACLIGVEKWADDYWIAQVEKQLALSGHSVTDTDEFIRHSVRHKLEHTVMPIVDDCDAKTRHTLQSTFRKLRHPYVGDVWPSRNLFHDDLYFGDSRYSTGIQLADLCSYVIGRHLEGDRSIEHYYEKVASRLAHSLTFPIGQECILAKMEVPMEDLSNQKSRLTVSLLSSRQNVRQRLVV